MGHVHVVGTRKQPGRCAYCHDALGALGHRCEGCGTWIHLDCWRELGTCPSPGCDAPPPKDGRAGGERRPRREHATPGGRRRGARQHARTDQDLRDWAEESRRRPREYGWWAGVSPYLRLTLSLVFNLALVVGMAAFVLWLLKDPAHAWESLRTGKHGHKSDVNAVISLLMAFGLGGFFSVRAGVWLYRWPGVWTETGRLLSFARPQPMRLQVWHEGRGKHRKTYAAFRPVDGSLRGPNPLRQVTLEGILPPLWLRSECARKPVLVYGLEDGQPPFLIEDTSGQLALLYP